MVLLTLWGLMGWRQREKWGESQRDTGGCAQGWAEAGGWERYPKLSLPNNIHHLMIVMLNERAMLGV